MRGMDTPDRRCLGVTGHIAINAPDAMPADAITLLVRAATMVVDVGPFDVSSAVAWRQPDWPAGHWHVDVDVAVRLAGSVPPGMRDWVADHLLWDYTDAYYDLHPHVETVEVDLEIELGA